MLFFSYLVQNRAIMKSLGSFLTISLLLLLLPGVGLCIETKADTVVKVSGKVTNSQTKEPVEASIIYEKLPYADDMGVSHSNVEGLYQMFMLKNAEYKVRVIAPGFIDSNQSVEIPGGYWDVLTSSAPRLQTFGNGLAGDPEGMARQKALLPSPIAPPDGCSDTAQVDIDEAGSSLPRTSCGRDLRGRGPNLHKPTLGL